MEVSDTSTILKLKIKKIKKERDELKLRNTELENLGSTRKLSKTY
jgi:hypothetical protein